MTLLLSVGVAGCGGTGSTSQSNATNRPAATPSAARQREAQAAATALRKHGALLAGPIDPRAVISVDECPPRVGGADTIECNVGQGVGGEDPILLQVRLQADGTLSKVLGKARPVPGPKSSAQTAGLLAADDRFQHAPSRTEAYRCAPSPRIEPDGTRARASTTGELCSTHFRVSNTDVRRYVEFAPDGTATRDYLVRGE